MPPSIPVSSLLNAETPLAVSHSAPSGLQTLQGQLALLAGLHDRSLPLNTPPVIVESLTRILDHFDLHSGPEHHPGSAGRSAPPPVHSPPPVLLQPSPTIRKNVYLNRKTTLSVLYTFEDVNAWVEYPETDPDRPVGYLFRRDPDNWYNPVHNFAYSLGEPSGQTRRGHEVENPLLIDHNGINVPCVVAHWTCKST
jgi:hypothetical protein